jgi:tetratricopeptide (TPR) repeat protein
VNDPPAARSRALFDAALARPPHARLDYLRQACAGDPTMLRDVLELVELHDRFEAEDPDGGILGTRVGPYRIDRVLGAGGMGRVYLAERVDGAFERQVAIKVVNPFATEEDVIERLETECRMLAALDHPNIATLLDAGRMADGRLYFVMEYIDGLPITQYAEGRNLSFRERLRLMRQVCDAVAFAHRNLIVHRDLKPANILVDAGGTPKLLDFGIAKALTRAGLEAGDPTHPLFRRATRGYASPEQLRGETAHTGMDVYALGVVFHELICGLRPVELPPDGPTTTGGLTHQPPSTLADAFGSLYRELGPVAQDVDAIVLKALSGDVRRRYPSADVLGRDIDALLEKRPVSARAATVRYRARTFVRRNPALVGLAAAAVVAALVAVASLGYMWQQERSQRQAAVRRFDDLQRLAMSFFDADGQLAAIPGTTSVRQSLTSSMTTYLDALRASPYADPRTLLDVAEGYRRLGDIQGNPNSAHLGDPNGARDSYAAAVTILRTLAGDASEPRVLAALAETLASSGDVHAAQGAPADAVTAYQEAAGIATNLVDSHAEDPRHAELLARIQRSSGDLALANGDAVAARDAYARAITIESTLGRRFGETPERRRLIALTRLRMAAAHEKGGAWKEAYAQYTAAIESLRGLRDGEERAAELMRDTAVGLTRLASMLRASDPEAADRHLREGIALLRRLVEVDKADVRARRDLYLALVQQGDLAQADDPTAASARYREAYKLAEPLGRENDASVREDLEMIRGRLAAGPRAVRPLLRLFVVADGKRTPLGPTASVPRSADSVEVSVQAPARWSWYLLVFGAEGEARVLGERELAQAGWRLPLIGPPPAQTVLLLALPRPLSPDERRALPASIAEIPGPRAIDWDSQVVWTNEEAEPQILSMASARGGADMSWIDAVRRSLTRIPDARFTGLTFPIAPSR